VIEKKTRQVLKRPQHKGSKFETVVQKTIGSGRLWFAPLDLDYDKHLIECKYTEKKGYRISRDLLEKIWDQSLSINKEPILVIGIKRDDDTMFTVTATINVERKRL